MTSGGAMAAWARLIFRSASTSIHTQLSVGAFAYEDIGAIT